MNHSITRTVLIGMVLLGMRSVGVEAQQVVDRIAVRDRSQHGTVVLRELVSGLRNPWAVATLPDGGALITERPGRLWYLTSLNPGAGRITEVTGVPSVAAIRQGGLLDVVISPTFEDDRLIYLSYAEGRGGGARTAVARGELVVSAAGERVSARLIDVERIFAMRASSSTGQHFGSRLAFDRAGLLYITIGDRGNAPLAQDVGSHAGSVVRIRPDGSIPATNPSIAGGSPGLFSWGHRNSQGIAWNPDDDAVWLHEHGPRGGDEINIVTAGGNYGWPRVTRGVAYSGAPIAEASSIPGLIDPILHWTPSIAPSGMAFIGESDLPEWNGDLLVGALAGQHLRRVELDGRRIVAEEELFSGFGRIRDVRQGVDGKIYLLTDSADGGLFRLERAE